LITRAGEIPFGSFVLYLGFLDDPVRFLDTSRHPIDVGFQDVADDIHRDMKEEEERPAEQADNGEYDNQ
jgi:hypothetical protein